MHAWNFDRWSAMIEMLTRGLYYWKETRFKYFFIQNGFSSMASHSFMVVRPVTAMLEYSFRYRTKN